MTYVPHVRAKLTFDQAEDIRRRLAVQTGRPTLKTLALEYNVSAETIRRVRDFVCFKPDIPKSSR